jgi:glutamate/tyrosine decarboxylase-like PLP-dependent enzyme
MIAHSGPVLLQSHLPQSAAGRQAVRRIWKRLVREVQGYLSGVDRLPVTPRVTAGGLRGRLEADFDLERPRPLEELIPRVAAVLREAGLHTAHRRYFGLFNPCVRPAGVAGDALAAAFNPNLAAWQHAPAAHEIEQHTLRWLARRFGLEPEATAAHFTTGGAEANLTAVLAALTRSFPGYGERGLRALPAQPVFYASGEAHHSFQKIAHSSGLGREAARAVRVDAELRLDPGELQRRIAEDRAAGLAPFLVAATAGTTAAGVIDPLESLAELCAREGLWLHVDAAWGGAAALSPRLRGHLRGLERADSLTCDAHKWLGAPMGAGMFFCRHPAAIAESFRVSASYMPDPTLQPDPYVASVQWSRRFIGLKVFLTLAELGGEELAEVIEHQAALGRELRGRLEAAGWLLVNQTPLPVVCATHPRIREGRTTVKAVVERVQARGQAWVSEVLLAGSTPAVRACITNHRTTSADLAFLVEELERCLSGA